MTDNEYYQNKLKLLREVLEMEDVYGLMTSCEREEFNEFLMELIFMSKEIKEFLLNYE